MIEEGKHIIDKNIVEVSINYINFDGDIKTGILEVHNKVSNEVKLIFDEILDLEFPIFQIKTIDNFDFSDEISVRNNNTSGYNFRFVNNSTKLSDHSLGLAIDINPMQNPWVHPSALNIFKYDPTKKGSIVVNSKLVNIFKKYGWSWGGDWLNPDYQHFFKSGKVNNDIKNHIYNQLGIDNPFIKISKFNEFKNNLKRK